MSKLNERVKVLEDLVKQMGATPAGPMGSPIGAGEGADTAMDSGSGTLSLSEKKKKISEIAKAKVKAYLTPEEEAGRRSEYWQGKMKGPSGVQEESGWFPGESLMGRKVRTARAIAARPTVSDYPEHQAVEMPGSKAIAESKKILSGAKEMVRQKIKEQKKIKPHLP